MVSLSPTNRMIKHNMDVLSHYCNLPNDISQCTESLMKDTDICLFKALRDETQIYDAGSSTWAMPRFCLELQPLVIQMLANASDELIGYWSSGSVCTFRSTISKKDFSEHYGHRLRYNELDRTQATFLVSQFASYYWQSVRKLGIRDSLDAALRFRLPVEIVKSLACSPVHAIYDFCFGFPGIQHFELTCLESDLLNISNAYYDETLSPEEKIVRINALRHIKASRSALH